MTVQVTFLSGEVLQITNAEAVWTSDAFIVVRTVPPSPNTYYFPGSALKVVRKII